MFIPSNQHNNNMILFHGDDFEAKFNRDTWFLQLDHKSSLEIKSPAGNNIVVELSPVYTGVIRNRPFLISDIYGDNGVAFRQLFYQSSGSATPNISPKGTWQPFSCLWTEGMVRLHPEYGVPIGWLAKEWWSVSNKKWILHHKTRDSLGGFYQVVCDHLQKMYP